MYTYTYDMSYYETISFLYSQKSCEALVDRSGSHSISGMVDIGSFGQTNRTYVVMYCP